MRNIVRKLKPTNYEIRVALDALNARRKKQRAQGIDNSATSDLMLMLLDVLDA